MSSALDSKARPPATGPDPDPVLRRAEGGDPSAQVEVGLRYQLGRGVKADGALSAGWFQRAASQGHADGQYRFALCLHRGYGLKRDKPRSSQLMRLSADQGHPLALAECMLDGNGTAKDELAAFAAYKARADLDKDPEACTHVGWCAILGVGTAKDPDLAISYYRAAAEQGHAIAFCNLAKCYEDGEGVEKSNALALQHYLRSVEQGYALAWGSVGWFHEKGLELPVDPLKAVACYRVAADLGDVFSQFNLALAYELGHGVPRNPRMAAHLYAQAADEDPNAQANLGVLISRGDGAPLDDALALHLFHCSAERGNIESLHNLGMMLWDGGRGFEQDREAALSYLERAAAHNHLHSLTFLANAYHTGQGVPRDPARAEQYMQQAANAPNDDDMDQFMHDLIHAPINPDDFMQFIDAMNPVDQGNLMELQLLVQQLGLGEPPAPEDEDGPEPGEAE